MNSTRSLLTPAELEGGVIHVVVVHLDAPPLSVAELRAVVSPDEVARAGRFLHDADCNRHIIGRALLRLSLARLMAVPPESIRLEMGEFGKPYLADGPSFNISHSGNAIVVAIAHAGRLGVDVEAVRHLRDLLGLARTSFAYDELCSVVTLPHEERRHAFFRVWARKEAMLKALGLGLTALDAISVSSDEATANALLRLDLAGEHLSRWTVRPISCGLEAECAVAWDRPLRRVELLSL